LGILPTVKCVCLYTFDILSDGNHFVTVLILYSRKFLLEPTFRSLKTHFWIFSIALSTSFTGLLIYPEVLERERMIYFWYLYLIYMEIGR
jgi:hypothetical protein